MSGNPNKSDFDLARAILSGVPDTRVSRGAVKIAAYVKLKLEEDRKRRAPVKASK